MESITVGIDLAKEVFSVCVVNAQGRVVQRRDLKRAALPAWLQQLPSGTVVGMEACSGAHYWGRVCQSLGLVPRLMAAQFVKPFRKNGAVKNDRQDAEAIVTAVRQGTMRFVSVKTVDQQARLSWHRVREGCKKDALAVSNRMRGLLAEFGIVIGQSDAALRRALADLDAVELPLEVRELLRQQQRHWAAIEAEQLWIVQLAARLPFGKVLVAIANKHARQIWAMLARGEAYDPEAWVHHPMVQRG